ncbi:MAG: hypothetical protein KF784_03625 [Fimbriimonadaceae bacterium]|nr:hypothetical protein [Fimbriimonadaceae bacterium]
MKLLLLTAVGSAGLACLVFFALTIYINRPFNAAADNLSKLRKEAVAAGLPTTITQQHADNPVPNEANAANEMIHALVLLDKIEPRIVENSKNWTATFEHGTVEDRKQVLTEAKQTQPCINALYIAAQKPLVRFERDWELPSKISVSEYSKIKSAVSLLTASAFLDAQQGDIEHAIQNIEAAYRISNQLAGEAPLTALMTRERCLRISDFGVNFILDKVGKDPSVLERLSKIVAAGHPPIDVFWSAKTEFVFGYMFLNETARTTVSWNQAFEDIGLGSADRGIPSLSSKRAVSDGFEARFLEGYLSAKAAYDKSKSYLAFCAELDRQRVMATSNKDPSYIFLSLVTPHWNYTINVLNEGQCFHDLLVASIEVAKFKQRTGRLPKNLEEVGVFTPDIYGSGPLFYRIEGTRAVVYSLGKNGIDDGSPLGESSDDLRMAYPPYIPKR